MLELYLRGDVWWFKGRIEGLPGSRYYRQSTGQTTKAGASAILIDFQKRELVKHHSGNEVSLTFSEAVNLYKANSEMARDLLKVIDLLGNMEVRKITPKLVKELGPRIYPDGSTDSWKRHVVTPIRAVINNAHELGLCPPIRIKAYKEIERVRQDQLRRKISRAEKTPGNWSWIMKFREKAPAQLGALALFMFETGARIGQATAISFDDFDADAARIWMPAAKGFNPQWVVLSPELSEDLKQLRPRITRRKSGKRVLSNRLFGYLRKDSVYKIWRRVCRDAKIEPIMPHAAGRHGFGTEMLVRQGVDVVTVARAGRWSDAQMLLQTYAHPENHQDRILAALRTGREQTNPPQRRKYKKKKEKC